METHIATRKPQWCYACKRRIPVGARYFYTDIDEGIREHTNCEDFKDEPIFASLEACRDAWRNGQNAEETGR